MRTLLSEIRTILGRAYGGRLALLFAGLSFIGVVEVVGVGSILPFLAVASDPGLIDTNPVLRRMFELLRFADAESFTVFMGLVSLLLVTLGNALNLAVAYAFTRFAVRQGQRISSFLLERHLAKPYEYYYRHNVAELVGQIFLEVRKVTSGVLQPVMAALSRLASVFAILGLLLYVSGYITLAVTAFFSLVYYALFRFHRNSLYQFGKRASDADARRVKSAVEALGAIKEVKTSKAERYFVDSFDKTSSVVAQAESVAFLAAHGPRYALEALAFGALVVVALALALRPDRGGEVVPLLALFAFAGYRILPAVQQLFSAAASIRFNRDALQRVALEFALDTPPTQRADAPAVDRALNRTWKCIELADVEVRFENRLSPALDCSGLTIRRGVSIGVTGRTGAGKSTLIDVLAGLVTPTRGAVRIDGVPLSLVVMQWLDCIGYVPQNPHFLDATIAENIAFGRHVSDIDMRRVRLAAEQSCIADFIESALPDGYLTRVGDGGICLSGGQRQRVAIARALYREPSLMLLDEATSAVDEDTEAAILRNLHATPGRTIVFVTHRTETLRICDQVLIWEDGRLRACHGHDERKWRSPPGAPMYRRGNRTDETV